MKSYNFTARDSGGTLKRGRLTARDRSDALEKIKVQGMMPLTVDEQISSRPGGGGRFRVKLPAGGIKLAAGALAVALGVVVVVMVLARRSGERTRPAATPPAAGAGSATESRLRPDATAAQPPAPGETAQQQAETRLIPPGTSSVAAVGERATGAAAVAQKDPPSAPEENPPPPVRPFTTATEQVLGWISNARLGDPPPPLLELPPGEDIEKILATDIIVYSDETPEMEAAKYNVAHAKQLLKAYLAEGGNTRDFLAHYHTQLREAHAEWREAQIALGEMIKTGDIAGARAFAEKTNQELEERGIRPIFLPPALRK